MLSFTKERPQLYSVFLNIKKPIINNEIDRAAVTKEKISAEIEEGNLINDDNYTESIDPEDAVKQAFGDLLNNVEKTDKLDTESRFNSTRDVSDAALNDFAAKRNTDGIIGHDKKEEGIPNSNGQEFVVFNPNQIKSATNNNGDFSTENDNIDFQIEETPEQERERKNNSFVDYYYTEMSDRVKHTFFKGIEHAASQGLSRWQKMSKGLYALNQMKAGEVKLVEAFHSVYEVLLNEKEKEQIRKEVAPLLTPSQSPLATT